MIGPSFAPPRVLVVDDYPDAAESLALCLTVWGYEVKVAHDGPSAMALARQFQPGAVVLDIGMPGMDGWQLARMIRDHHGLEGTLLVALSGHGREQDYQRSHEAGCDVHLVKPFDPVQLMGVLANHQRHGRVGSQPS